MDASRVLLAGLIDDAGLFPPASKSMAEAVADHVRMRSGPDAWVGGRFLVPVSRLGRLADRETEVPRIVAVGHRHGADSLAVARDELETTRARARASDVEGVELRLPLLRGERRLRALLVEPTVAGQLDGPPRALELVAFDAARATFGAFGSCSFEEPLGLLRRHALLDAGAPT